MNAYLEWLGSPGNWMGFGLAVLCKSLLLLTLAWLVTLALRKASAAVRHWVWTLAFVGLAVLPLASFVLPTWEVPISTKLVPPAPADLAPTSARTHDTDEFETGTADSDLPKRGFSPTEHDNSSVGSWSWKKAAFAVWLSLFVIFAARLGAGFIASRHLVTRAAKVVDEKWVHMLDELSRHLGLNRYVELFQTERSMVPITCGILRPQVLLPSGAGEWSGKRRRSVLLHELGHVRRNDCLTQWVTQIVCAVYWWNPLVWFASKQLRQESERACDDLVLDAGTRASDYAHDLLDMARALNVTRRSPLASVTLAHRSRFEDRLLSILDPKARRHALSRMMTFASVLVAGALWLLLAVLQPSVRAQEQPSTSALSGSQKADGAVQDEPRQPEEERDDDAVHERTLTALVEALGDPEPTVRQQAVEILGSVGRGAAVPSLIEALNDRDAQVREGAASALGSLQDDRAVEPLLESLHDATAQVREQSAWALGILRDERAVGPLGERLEEDDDDGVREQAAWALGMIRDPSSVPQLLEALKDPQPYVREQAAWALGMIRDARATSGLTAMLKDEDPDVREQAVWALGMIQAPETVIPLIEFLKDADPDVREQAAWALGMIRDGRASQALAATLRDDDADVREQTAWALGMIQESAAVAPLIESLGDDEPDVREQAAWALGMIRDESAADALQAAMKDEDPDVREQAAWALGMILISRQSSDISHH